MTTKKLPNYSRAKIYKIISNQTDDIYIGSTTKEYLSQRMTAHKYEYKQYSLGKRKLYYSSFELLKYDDVKIVLLEAYPDCKTKDELRKYEQEWLDKLECINKIKAYTTDEQKKNYYINNKDVILEKAKQRRLDNLDEFREVRKKYYHDNKDAINEKIKQKRLEDPDKFREANKISVAKWRANNREFRNIKSNCDICSKKISKTNMSRHKRTIHKDLNP
jgi:hypothetical protein